MRALLAICLLASCGAHVNSDGDQDAATFEDAGPNSCSGSATRCDGGDFQTCVNDTFTTQQTCDNICSDTLGCIDCDPGAGSATCNGSDVVTCNPDGSFGTTLASCDEGMQCDPMGATCVHACTADGVDLIYAVDEANDFLSFDPRKLMTMPPGDPFTKIGTLSCPTTGQSVQPEGGSAVPMSMSVDRNGVGWVEYTDGEVFNVSLQDATCTATTWAADSGGMELFGMGFSTDTSGGNTEKLFIAGGGNAAQPKGKLAYTDPANMVFTPTVVTTMMAQSSSYSPELTGTSDAKLYGFFPVLATPAYVQEIDKSTGSGVGSAMDLGSAGLGGGIRDWAFAQWGGIFYVFVTTSDASGNNLVSSVRSIDRTTGAYTVITTNPTFKQVDGAGVSTCAPITISSKH